MWASLQMCSSKWNMVRTRMKPLWSVRSWLQLDCRFPPFPQLNLPSRLILAQLFSGKCRRCETPPGAWRSEWGGEGGCFRMEKVFWFTRCDKCGGFHCGWRLWRRTADGLKIMDSEEQRWERRYQPITKWDEQKRLQFLASMTVLKKKQLKIHRPYISPANIFGIFLLLLSPVVRVYVSIIDPIL